MSRLDRALRLIFSKRAVSPIIATLLLIVISVAGAVLVFQLIGGIGSQVSSQPGVSSSGSFITVQGAMLWNKAFTANTTQAGQATFILFNTGAGNLTVQRVNMVDSAGNLLEAASPLLGITTPALVTQGVAAVSFKLDTNATAGSTGTFFVFEKSPQSTATANALPGGNTGSANLLLAGKTSYLTVGFGTTSSTLKGVLGGTGFIGGTVYAFQLIFSDGSKVDFQFKAT